MRAVVLAIILGLPAIAGCVLPEEAAEVAPAQDAPIAAEPARGPPPALPPRASPPALVVNVTDRWVRPGESVEAAAVVTPNAPVEWYLVSRNPIPHTHIVPLAFSVGPQGSASVALDIEGRVRLAGAEGGPWVNITLVPKAPAARVVVIAREDEGVWRLHPEEIIAGPGSRLVVQNTADAPLVLEEVERLSALGGGAKISFIMPPDLELGDYDLVALARADDGGVAEAAARLIYDRRKPERAFETSAFIGHFDAAATDPSARHAWSTRHEAVSVEVLIESTSDAPLPHAVRVALLAADGSELAAGSAPGFRVERVPAGEHAIAVVAEEGVRVHYAVRLRGAWDLVTPESFFSR